MKLGRDEEEHWVTRTLSEGWIRKIGLGFKQEDVGRRRGCKSRRIVATPNALAADFRAEPGFGNVGAVRFRLLNTDNVSSIQKYIGLPRQKLGLIYIVPTGNNIRY